MIKTRGLREVMFWSSFFRRNIKLEEFSREAHRLTRMVTKDRYQDKVSLCEMDKRCKL